jgi:hypothetical protein
LRLESIGHYLGDLFPTTTKRFMNRVVWVHLLEALRAIVVEPLEGGGVELVDGDVVV